MSDATAPPAGNNEVAGAMLLADPEQLGVAVLALRQEIGLSQAEFAVRAGTTQAQVSRWELGETRPSMAAFMRICRAAGKQLGVFDV